MKSFLGTGLLGSNFVRAMLKRGEAVNVWNRTSSKAKALDQYGAKSFESPAEAVDGADLIHLTLRDDASVDEVLAAAAPGIKPGAVIIDHTTTSKEGAIERTNLWSKRGFYYQHAPVFMGPLNALEGTGFMLLSGDQELVKKVEPHLAPMTGSILHFGPEVGKAAAMKLVGNTFLVCFTAGVRETLVMAKVLDIDEKDLLQLFDSWNPASMLQARLKRMSSGNYSDPSWELAMARKDTGLFLTAAEKVNADLRLLPSIATLMDEWIAKGYGNNDWTVIGKDIL